MRKHRMGGKKDMTTEEEGGNIELGMKKKKMEGD